MAYLTTLKNTGLPVDPIADYSYQGWEISGNTATHYPCNAGIMTATNKPIVIGKTYTVTYEVSNYISGGVNILLGTTPGATRAANGVYTEDILVAGNTNVSMFSDGYLSIRYISAFEKQSNIVDNAVTICFNEPNKHWSTNYSFQPELMLRFLNIFFMFKNGGLWRHNSENDNLRNVFFGVKYPSKITYYVNNDPTVVKNFYSQRIESNKAWGSPNIGDISILPTSGKPNGQKSLLKRGNYKRYQGSWFGDFLRDATDPRFADQNLALLRGADLQGRVMEVTIENDDMGEVVLTCVDVKTNPSMYSY